MKVEKFKVLLYLKKSGLDKSGKAPIMGRITVNNSIAQFSLKLSCTPTLWDSRESRLDGKSQEAVETNGKIEKLLLAVHSAFDTLVERKQPFDATAVKNLFQGSIGTQITLLKLLDRHIEELGSRVGIDRSAGTQTKWVYTRRYLSEFIEQKFKTKDLAFGQLNEQFIRDFQDFILQDKGFAMDTLRHDLAILKKICKIAYKEGRIGRACYRYIGAPQHDKRRIVPIGAFWNIGLFAPCLRGSRRQVAIEIIKTEACASNKA